MRHSTLDIHEIPERALVLVKSRQYASFFASEIKRERGIDFFKTLQLMIVSTQFGFVELKGIDRPIWLTEGAIDFISPDRRLELMTLIVSANNRRAARLSNRGQK